MPPHGHSTTSHISHTASRPMTTHRSTSSISRSTSSYRSISSSTSRSTSTHSYSSNTSSHSTSTHTAPSTHSTSTHTTSSKPKTTTKPSTSPTLHTNYKSTDYISSPKNNNCNIIQTGNVNNCTIIQTGGDHSNQYSNIEINNSYEKNTDKIKKVKCPYCDSKFEYNESKIDDITEFKCPNCGAKLEREDIDISVAPKKNANSKYNTKAANTNYKKLTKEEVIFFSLIAGGTAAVILFVVAIALALSRYNSTVESDVIVNGTDTIIINNTDTVKDQQEENSIYVSEIGRTCYLLEDGNYYDPDTDCYFWYNTDVYPNTWQYWYEGISSDYGDYGWMEYDVSEGLWYIQVSDYDWIILPDEYDTSYLWYIQ